jgi:uncharacterized protein YneF (UPF0154 family)
MKTALLVLIISIAAIVFGLVVIILIGIKENKRRESEINKYNEASIKAFMKAQKGKKYARKSTPKVPTIK